MLRLCQSKRVNEANEREVGDCSSQRARGCENTRLPIPARALSRSPALETILTELDADEDISSSVPKYLLDSWLECLDVLPSLFTHSTELLSVSTAVRYLTASDYFGDDAAVRDMSKVLGTCLFGEAVSRDGARGLDVSARKRKVASLVREAFVELSDDLAISVLASSSCSLDVQMRILPQDCFHSAVHAWFPSLLAQNRLELDCADCAATTVMTVLRTVLNSPTVRHIVLSNLYLRDAQFVRAQHNLVEDLVKVVSSQHVQDVTFSATVFHPQSLTAVLGAMATSRSVKSLNITSMYAASGDAAELESALSAGLARMHSLESLTLSELDFVSNTVGPVSDALKALTALTYLKTSRCAQNAGTVASYLPEMRHLQRLEIYFHVRTAEEATALSSAISDLTQLTHLTLSGETVPVRLKSFTHFFAEKLSTLENLHCLDMRGSIISNSGICLLSEAAKNMPFLSALMLDVFVVTNDSLQLWNSVMNFQLTEISLRSEFHISTYADRSLPVNACEKLGQMANLKRVHIPRYLLSVPSRSALGSTLQAMSGVTRLTLEDHPKSLPDATDFLYGLGALKSLARLEITGCAMTEEEAFSFAHGISQVSALRSLHLNRLNASVLTANAICSSIEKLSLLTCLQMIDVYSDTVGLKSMFCAFKEMSNLKQLNLSRLASRYERLSLTGCTENLTTALSVMRSLEDLSVSGWYIRGTCLNALTRAISELQNLTRLDLRNCGVCDNSISDVADAVRFLPKLRSLDLSLNELTAASLEGLMAATIQSTSMRALSIMCNPVTDKGVRRVAELLSSSGSIRELDLRQTGLSKRGVQELCNLVPRRDPATRIICSSCYDTSSLAEELVNGVLWR